MLPQYRVGMITPSSNTCLEVVTSQILAGRDDVGMHVTRLPVTRIAVDDTSDDQFASTRMIEAARQLADAQVDVLVWNGTAGAWLGVARDAELCAQITAATGIPATTSALAIVESLRHLGVNRFGLAVPYTANVAELIVREFARNGLTAVGVSALGIETNYDFARLSRAQVESMVVDAAASGAGAVAVVCTNVPAAGLVPQLEKSLGIPVCDSVAVTLWQALRLLGVDPVVPGWGRLLSGEIAGSAADSGAESREEIK